MTLPLTKEQLRNRFRPLVRSILLDGYWCQLADGALLWQRLQLKEHEAMALLDMIHDALNEPEMRQGKKGHAAGCPCQGCEKERKK
jgi:hypothetical protein